MPFYGQKRASFFPGIGFLLITVSPCPLSPRHSYRPTSTAFSRRSEIVIIVINVPLHLLHEVNLQVWPQSFQDDSHCDFGNASLQVLTPSPARKMKPVRADVSYF